MKTINAEKNIDGSDLINFLTFVTLKMLIDRNLIHPRINKLSIYELNALLVNITTPGELAQTFVFYVNIVDAMQYEPMSALGRKPPLRQP
jgi:hypothetical protein